MPKALTHLTMMATLALASFNLAGSCGPNGVDLCDKVCNCPPLCSGAGRLKCKLDADQTLMRTVENDCEETYHSYISCEYNGFMCKDGMGYKGDCGAEYTALTTCDPDAVVP